MLWAVLALLAVAGQARADGAVPVHRLLLDVRSTHSDGAHDVDTLVRLAQARDIDVLAITDHDRKAVRLGLAPFPGLLGWTIDRRSLYTTGLDPFFADIVRARKRYPQMTLLAGTESAPGYSWSGIPFLNLTLHNAERAVITLGEEKPAQIRALPSFGLRHARGSLALGLIFWGLLIGGLFAWMLRRRLRGLALLLSLATCGFALWWWAQTPPDADAAFIRTAEGEGLFTVWAHPGTRSGVRQGPMGVWLDTPPHPEAVFRRPLADGFAGIYGDTDHLAEPGGRWDAFLAAYLHGRAKKPVWAISAGDFHGQAQDGEYLGNFPMDLWTADATPTGVLVAMHRGHMVAWGLPRDRNLRFASLTCVDAGGQRLLPGDRAEVGRDITVAGQLVERTAAAAGATTSWPVQIIVDGKVVATPTLTLGQPFRWPLRLAPGPHAVRLRLWQGSIRMLSNPFLLQVRG